MKKICNKANVKHFGFHAIRHLSASILYKKGNSVSIIQAILRHKNPNTTTRYLRTIGLEDTRSALEEGFRKPAEVIPFSVAVNS
jgi:integrase